MRHFILHHVARVLRVLIHIDGLPYGYAPTGEAALATQRQGC
jgi:hypothetical protein